MAGCQRDTRTPNARRAEKFWAWHTRTGCRQTTSPLAEGDGFAQLRCCWQGRAFSPLGCPSPPSHPSLPPAPHCPSLRPHIALPLFACTVAPPNCRNTVGSARPPPLLRLPAPSSAPRFSQTDRPRNRRRRPCRNGTRPLPAAMCTSDALGPMQSRLSSHPQELAACLHKVRPRVPAAHAHARCAPLRRAAQWPPFAENCFSRSGHLHLQPA